MKFTLLQLLLLIGVVAMLVALLIPRFLRARQRPRKTARAGFLAALLLPAFLRTRRLALANTGGPGLGLMNENGRLNLLIASSVTTPVGNRWLLWEYNTDSDHVVIALGVNRPLGPSPDAPSATLSGAAQQLSVYALGAVKGTVLGIAHSTITAGDTLVASTTAGQIDDLNTLGAGTYWVVGVAIQTVAAGAEFAYIPYPPFKVNQSTNAVTLTATGN